MHNNHGGTGRGSPGGHTAVHHHHHQGRILPRNRCALKCIDKHDDDVQASAREDQPGSGADGEYEATDDRYPS